MSLKLIGAGFGRTGTLSIKVALERLGLGPCYHMIEVLHRPGAVAHWGRAARGEPVDWDEVFQGYQCAVDWPACSYWRELAAEYPDARVLLSVRDPERWFESTQRTIFSGSHLERLLGPDADEDTRDMIERLFVRTFDGRGNDREYAISVFQRHCEEVKSTIGPERLLVFDTAQGWGPLCEFLDVAVPDEPFPRVNSTEEWLNR